MLSLLLDENISPEIAVQVSAKRPDLPILSLYHWRDGAFTATADSLILEAAAQDGLTLVTYDLETIPPLLSEWRMSGIAHGGVILVDGHTIRSHDFGGLVCALIDFWDEWNEANWRNRIMFLKRARGSF